MLSLNTFLKLADILDNDAKVVYLRKDVSQVSEKDWEKLTGREIRWKYDLRHTIITDIRECKRDKAFLGYLLTISEGKSLHS